MNSKIVYSVKRFIRLLLVLAILCPAAVKSSAIAADIDNALKEIVTYKFGDSRENLSVVADHVKATYSKPGERAKLEKQFTRILKSDASPECKDFICRQLRVIGTGVDASVQGVHHGLKPILLCQGAGQLLGHSAHHLLRMKHRALRHGQLGGARSQVLLLGHQIRLRQSLVLVV